MGGPRHPDGHVARAVPGRRADAENLLPVEPAEMTSFLIKGARGILTGRKGDAARVQGDVRVVDGVITEIGALTPAPGEKIIDASGCVVTPGLVNTHHHLFQSVLKAVPAG